MGNCCEFLNRRYSSSASSSLLDDFDLEFAAQPSKYSQPASANLMDQNNNSHSFANSPPRKLTRKNTQTIYSDENHLAKKIDINDFEPIKLLGKGSFGKVMLVQQKSSGSYFAMKILRKDAIAKRNQRLHTQAERAILSDMKCPFIVGLHYAFQSSTKLFLAMDFMQGGELFFHLRRAFKFPEQKAKFYSAEIVLALEALHSKRIIYRDLKPENILLGADGHIKIVDFGLSKQGIESNSRKKTYSFCGTPEYLAPEILLGKGHNQAVDWWSLGVLLYEMITGFPPFFSTDKSKLYTMIFEKNVEIKSYFSPEVSSLLIGLLTKQPQKRLGSLNDAKEIKAHSFYKDINWKLLHERKIPPPFEPKLNGSDDLRYFDKAFTDEILKDSPNPSKIITDDYPDFTYDQGEFSLHENNGGEKNLLNGLDNLEFSFSKGNSEEKLLTPKKIDSNKSTSMKK